MMNSGHPQTLEKCIIFYSSDLPLQKHQQSTPYLSKVAQFEKQVLKHLTFPTLTPWVT